MVDQGKVGGFAWLPTTYFRAHGVELRQSYRRVAKRAAIMVGRCTHAHQFRRARRELKFLRTRLGRVIRGDICRRSIDSRTSRALCRAIGAGLLAVPVRFQDHRSTALKVYALHVPEVERIANGKARAPYEFGCKSLPPQKQGYRWRRRRPKPRAPVRAVRQGAAWRSV